MAGLRCRSKVVGTIQCGTQDLYAAVFGYNLADRMRLRYILFLYVFVVVPGKHDINIIALAEILTVAAINRLWEWPYGMSSIRLSRNDLARFDSFISTGRVVLGDGVRMLVEDSDPCVVSSGDHVE